MSEKKRLLLIDSNSIIHRAFHALPPLKKKDGEVVNAVYGFLLIFIKSVKDFRPDYIIAAFDVPFPTFRHKKFKGYKVKRVAAPDELYSQIPLVKEFLRLFRVPVLEKKGFEADDIIGTVSRDFPGMEPQAETIILSGDTDNLQLVDGKTKVSAIKTGVKETILYDENMVRSRFGGLSPKQLVDYKGLRGDSSDNIPGVLGIGEKTAISLLLEFGSLENIYKNLKSKKIPERTRKLLADHKDQAFLSRELGKIETRIPLKINIKDCLWGKYDKEEILKEIDNYQFSSLRKRIEGLMDNGEIGKNLKLW
jgi:DNA polymerase-1